MLLPLKMKIPEKEVFDVKLKVFDISWKTETPLIQAAWSCVMLILNWACEKIDETKFCSLN